MAVLERIRKKGGLVASIVGLALLAFVMGDLLSSGSSIFNPDYSLAKIDGEEIPFPLYQQKLSRLESIVKQNTRKSSLDASTLESLRDQTWNEILKEHIMQKEYNELGLAVNSNELYDMVQGEKIHPTVERLFKNPETGKADKNAILQFLKNLDNSNGKSQKNYWLFVESTLMKDRILAKYGNLIKKSFFVTKNEMENDFLEKNKKVDFKYIVQNFKSIPDSTIEITENDISNYYEKHKKDFEQKVSRDIEYVAFTVKASSKDRKNARKWVLNQKTNLKNSKNDKQYISLNSDENFDKKFHKKGELNKKIDSLMFAKEIGFVTDVYQDGQNYKISKISDIKFLPDTVKARHILIKVDAKTDIAKANSMADSLKNLIKKGQNFAKLAKKFSEDKGSGAKGGDLGWFKEGQMVKAFNDACFEGKKGDMTIVESQFGVHLIELQDKGKEVKKVQIATLTKKIMASDETREKEYQKASRFQGMNQDGESFTNAVKKEKLSKRIANNIKENDKKISGLESPRELVRWIYKAEINTVSPVFEFGNKFVVALLTEIKEEGYANIEQVKNEIESKIRKEKKSKILMEKVNKELANVKSLEELSKKLDTKVENSKNISFSSRNAGKMGYEPKIVALATNLEKEKLSKTIEGNNGIFVVFVTKITDAKLKEDYKDDKKKLVKTRTSRVDYQVYKTLKESVEIEDNRSKFF
ncbi:MAG: hypothetical protein B6I24_00435 [Bacteroidetes bacterium 4572_128]|nr:MAG: hypothetical protein B6I24_00435 [Bacteroidetes bacterium 4572_128]